MFYKFPMGIHKTIAVLITSCVGLPIRTNKTLPFRKRIVQVVKFTREIYHVTTKMVICYREGTTKLELKLCQIRLTP